jgi:hypothetical protein
MADSGSLADSLIGIHAGKAGPEILDRYSDARRAIFQKFVDPVSTGNLTRLCQDPDELLKDDEMIKKMRETYNDKEASRKLQMVSSCALKSDWIGD